MFLTEPQRTQFDLNFNLGPIPVTVNPWFWLISLLFAFQAEATGVNLLISVGVVFVSILIHELGHAVTMMYFGEQARIVLYGMGGLAISGGNNIWSSQSRHRSRSQQEQIIISFAGPLAGFLLAGVVIGVLYAIGGSIEFYFNREHPTDFFMVHSPPGMRLGISAYYLFHVALFVNILWGLVNLLPVYPLDGGQISRELFLLNDYRGGLTNSLWLSVITGGAMAVFGLMNGSLWMAFMFGSLAYSSYQALQNFGGGGGYGRGW